VPPDEPPPPLDRAAQKTYERALGLLAVRSRSVKQLQKRLIENGEPPEQVAPVIARLSAAGLLDDARYAAARARGGVGKARSERRMAETLAHDGVPREVAQAAIQQVLAEEGTSEQALAERAAHKKLRTLTRVPPLMQRQKLYAFLARQGYSAEVVRRTLRAVLDVAPPDEEG